VQRRESQSNVFARRQQAYIASLKNPDKIRVLPHPPNGVKIHPHDQAEKWKKEVRND